MNLVVEESTAFRRVDWNFLLLILALNLIGLLNLYSATHGQTSQDIQPLFLNQVVWLTAGWIALLTFTFVDYKIWYVLAYPLYFLNLAAVVATTFFGTVALGAQRWINLGFFRYQPSETMKIALVMVLARTLSKNSYYTGLGILDLITPLILILLPTVLIVEQPDLGTALLLLGISTTLLLFIRIKRWILLVCFSAVVVAAPLMWTYGLRDYQKARVFNFISPTNDPRGSGWNSIQSKVAVGSGRFVGKGFQKGTQSQLEFLPERHTDFIFSVLSEEHGFVGSLGTIFLFILLFTVGIRVAATSRDKHGTLLCIGILGYLFWHMFINIGMVIGLLPIVGVPLPLLSYGGSSMLTTMGSLGIVSAVAFRRFLFS